MSLREMAHLDFVPRGTSRPGSVTAERCLAAASSRYFSFRKAVTVVSGDGTGYALQRQQKAASV